MLKENHESDPHKCPKLRFHQLRELYAILRFEADAAVPSWAKGGEFLSITRTADELSIVCPAAAVPANVHSPHRWTCLKLEGPFPFSLTGVLLAFIEPLSNNDVPIFAVSTYDTDFVLIQQDHSEKAVALLQQAGHQLLAPPK